VEYVTGAIVNKILHDPVTRLREEAAGDHDPRYLQAIRQLFRLGDEDFTDDADE
jgi:glutamyl-tRNA reductase